MKIRNFWIIGLFLFLSATACKRDELPIERLLPIEERNQIDDAAVEKYLEEHYFNEKGKTTKYGTEPDDEQRPSLMSLATKDPSGFWYVKNPEVSATGEKVVNNEVSKILLQYDMFYFIASKNDKGEINYSPSVLASTINTTGKPEEPVFYHAGEDASSKKLYEIKSFIEGIKHFNATQRTVDALPAVHFQGLIIAPSRLVFGRESNKILNSSDFSVVINFELLQVSPRIK